MLSLLYFILILGLIILVHEFGHFIFAKIFGIYVYEFSLGMGPVIWRKKSKKGETDYCLRAIPIGGFVSMAGEEIDDDKKIPKDRKLYAKPIWQRFLVMFFGAGNNFILAFLLLFFIGIFSGAPVMDPVVSKLDENYPMYQAGIREGDTILAIDDQKVTTIDDIKIYLTITKPGEEIELKVKKENGQVIEYEVEPVKELKDGKESYVFGITFPNKVERGFLASIKYAFIKMGALFKQMIITFKALFTGMVGFNNLSGPVGIYSIVDEAKSYGIVSLLNLLILLSVNVGFVNLIPFPAFDGGKILFLLIEKIKGSPVNPKVENIIHGIGFILLMILIIVITCNDIIRMIFK